MTLTKLRQTLEPIWARRVRLTASARFVLSFAALSAAFFVPYFFPYAENGHSEAWFATYFGWYASLVGHTLQVFDPRVSVSGNVISGRFSMSIVKSCDGMEANILFCAATLAMPGRLSRKLLAAVVGLATLIAFNVLRLCSLYYIGVYFPSAFEFAHFDVWPLLIVSFALVDFLFFARWVRGKDSPAPNSAKSSQHAVA
jgi:exosortase H (IPTLxxWG-CTERM-specific)